ncbi:HU family DNA-binding protein [uncultured Bacteroides sp.]|uniref:HU family DNA-binding protein n=1 Tax=uncultured Bacteroides sp. TaxID=162156 RepID=UPI002AAC4406|nr:HU family DNA-binding protein [uncultured Bacteroides sp.]
MAVPYKKMARKDPRNKNATVKYYPQLVTMGQSADLNSIAYKMKEASSLSLGDIQSVLTNFVEAMRMSLFNGQSVNIRDFGVFSLSARTKGADKEKECTSKNIVSMKINFRPSSSVRPNLTSTRAGDKIEFIDIVAALEKQKEENGKDDNGGGNTGGNTGSNTGGNTGGDDEDPNA